MTPVEKLLAAAENPGGVDSAGVSGLSTKQMYDLARRLMKQGELFRAQLGHRTVRYFRHKEHAEAYERARTKKKGTHHAPRGPQQLQGEADFSKAEFTYGTPRPFEPCPPDKPITMRADALDYKRFTSKGAFDRSGK